MLRFGSSGSTGGVGEQRKHAVERQCYLVQYDTAYAHQLFYHTHTERSQVPNSNSRFLGNLSSAQHG